MLSITSEVTQCLKELQPEEDRQRANTAPADEPRLAVAWPGHANA